MDKLEGRKGNKTLQMEVRKSGLEVIVRMLSECERVLYYSTQSYRLVTPVQRADQNVAERLHYTTVVLHNSAFSSSRHEARRGTVATVHVHSCLKSHFGRSGALRRKGQEIKHCTQRFVPIAFSQ